MIHLIGMSHALSVVNAFDRSFAGMNMQDFATSHGNGTPLPTSFETLRGTDCRPHLREMKVFLIPRQRGWSTLVRLPEAAGSEEPVPVHRGFLELMVQIPQEPATVVLSMLFGNEHSALSIVEHDAPFDFILPERRDIAPVPGRQIVPCQAIRLQLQHGMRPTALVLEKMREMLPNCRIVHCAPPPPIGSAEQILASWENLGERIASVGVAPASIRLKFYLLQLEELDHIANQHGVTLLGPPPRSLTPEGLLRPEFWNGATHANAAYGGLVLDQLEECIQESAA